MAQVNLQQGEDVVIPILALLAGAPIDLTGIPDIRATLFITPPGGTKTAAKQYALNGPPAGYGRIVLPATPVNQFNIIVERADSRLFPVGIISIDYILQFADATYSSGFRHDEFNANSIGLVQLGALKDEPIP